MNVRWPSNAHIRTTSSSLFQNGPLQSSSTTVVTHGRMLPQLIIQRPSRSGFTDAYMLLLGLRVTQVKVIFRLPERFRAQSAASRLVSGLDGSPLAYIEWFRPFSRPDALGLYKLKRSTRGKLPNAEIIPLSQIYRSCHLVPRFKTAVHSRWNPHTVLDLCPEFYLNPWVSVDDFVAMRGSCL